MATTWEDYQEEAASFFRFLVLKQQLMLELTALGRTMTLMFWLNPIMQDLILYGL